MSRFFRTLDHAEELETESLDEKKISALKEDLRRNIMEMLAEQPSYPARMSDKLGLGKQKIYYHFQKLKDAGLIEKQREERHSGGTATFYQPTAQAYFLDIGGEGRRTFLPEKSTEIRRFLYPMISNGEINGSVVVGSSEPHGPDQVRARDGHLTGEITGKLGNHGELDGPVTMLDTELSRENDYDRNMIILGGILTNTAAKKFNGDLPVKFAGESFPYREIKTPENSYDDPNIGVVAKATHPDNPEKAIYIVAGVRAEGTRAAVVGFRDLGNILNNYKGGEFYRVVKGLDLDGDGMIDDYEVVE